jgi:hypothetical protein
MDPQTDRDRTPPGPDTAARDRLENDLLELRRAQTERATSDALRRIPLVIVTVLLVALALWWLQKS